MSLTEAEELELLLLEEEEAKASASAPKPAAEEQSLPSMVWDRARQIPSTMYDTVSKVPEGLSKVATGVKNLDYRQPLDYAQALALEGLPLAPIVGETVAGVAGLGGALYGAVMPGKSSSEEGMKAMEYVRNERQAALEAIDPSVRAAANVSGMLSPTGLVANLIEPAVPALQKMGIGELTDNEQLAKEGAADFITSGLVAGAVPAGMVAAKAPVRALTAPLRSKKLSELPGRLRGASSEDLTQYYTRPQEVKAASAAREIESLSQFADTKVAEFEDFSAKLKDAKAAAEEAKLTGSNELAAFDQQVKDLEQSVASSKEAFKETQRQKVQDLEDRRLALEETLAAEKTQRGVDVAESQAGTQEALRGAVEGIKGAEEAQKANIIAKAQEQASMLSEADVRIPTADIAAAAKKEMLPYMRQTGETKDGLPVYAGDDKALAVLAKLEALPPTLTPLQTLQLRRELGDVAYGSELGARGVGQAYQQVNKEFDSLLPSEGYKELRSTLAESIEARKLVKGVGERAETLLPKLGKSGTIKAEKTLDVLKKELGDKYPATVVEDYLRAKMEAEALQKAPLPSAQEKFKLKREGTLLKREQIPTTPEQVQLNQTAAERQRLQDYINRVLTERKSAVSMAETPVQTAKTGIETFGVPTTKEIGAREKWAQQLVKDEPIEGPTSKIPELSTVTGDADLAARLRDVRARESIMGSEPSPLGIGQMGAGAVPMARSLLKAAGSWVTTAPIDMRRWLNKVVGDERWGTMLHNAYLRGGGDYRNVAITHFLLQQKDPEYNKITTEEE